VTLAVTRGDGSVKRVEVPVSVWLGGARKYVVKVPARPAVTRVEIDASGLYPDVNRDNQRWTRQ
jgi:hypothetical protein